MDHLSQIPNTINYKQIYSRSLTIFHNTILPHRKLMNLHSASCARPFQSLLSIYDSFVLILFCALHYSHSEISADTRVLKCLSQNYMLLFFIYFYFLCVC